MAPPFLALLAAVRRVWKIWAKTGFGADVFRNRPKREKAIRMPWPM
jgi:ABC-type glucose/galactose transport system permease subunit